jgi:hypothetical protein
VLDKYGVEMIGASKEAIDKAEDREKFKQAMTKIGLGSARSGIAHSMEEAQQVQGAMGFPTIIRPSFTMGGSGGGILLASGTTTIVQGVLDVSGGAGGYGGEDCSLSQEALAERSALRGQLCSGVAAIQSAAEESAAALEDLSGSLLAAYAPYEVVTDADYARCAAALTGVTAAAEAGYLTAASLTAAVSRNTTGCVSLRTLRSSASSVNGNTATPISRNTVSMRARCVCQRYMNTLPPKRASHSRQTPASPELWASWPIARRNWNRPSRNRSC